MLFFGAYFFIKEFSKKKCDHNLHKKKNKQHNCF